MFRNPHLLEDYVERGLDVMQGFAASTIINHLTQLKKLFVWRELKARWENSSFHLMSESYDLDIMRTVSKLKVSDYLVFSLHLILLSFRSAIARRTRRQKPQESCSMKP